MFSIPQFALVLNNFHFVVRSNNTNICTFVCEQNIVMGRFYTRKKKLYFDSQQTTTVDYSPYLIHFWVGIPTNNSRYPSLAEHEWKTASPRFFSVRIERKTPAASVSSSVCYSSIGDPISIPLLLFLAQLELLPHYILFTLDTRREKNTSISSILP